MEPQHISVLKKEVSALFSESELSHFVDGTLGAGGHSESILQSHPEIKRFIGIDQDPLALNLAGERLKPWKEKTTFVAGNFVNIELYMHELGLKSVDGILLDLGVSSMQFDLAEKGFSFMKEGPLDMRMDPKSALTAEEIVNTWPENELGKIFRDYGEEKHWYRAAKAIVKSRPFKTTTELRDTLERALPKKKKGIHPVTLIFQALRICVNRELDVLSDVLPKAIDLLSPKGRLAIISFHSLEDRIVKNAFRFAASDKEQTSGIGGLFIDKDPVVKLLTRKAIMPSDQEIEENPRCRSSRLRAVEKL